MIHDLDYYLQLLKSVKQQMLARKMSVFPLLKYHGFAGAIYWSDEIPRRMHPEQENALRGLLRFRTVLIVGLGEQECKPFWDTAKEEFPDWIGFHRSRTTPDPRLVEFFNRSQQIFIESIEKSIDRKDT